MKTWFQLTSVVQEANWFITFQGLREDQYQAVLYRMTQQCPKDYFFPSLHSSSCSASCILRWCFWASQEVSQQLPATSLLIPVEKSVCLRESLSVRILRVTLIAPTEVTCPFLTNHCAWECPDWLSIGYLFGRNSFLVTSCIPKLKWDVLEREE